MHIQGLSLVRGVREICLSPTVFPHFLLFLPSFYTFTAEFPSCKASQVQLPVLTLLLQFSLFRIFVIARLSVTLKHVQLLAMSLKPQFLKHLAGFTVPRHFLVSKPCHYFCRGFPFPALLPFPFCSCSYTYFTPLHSTSWVGLWDSCFIAWHF